MLCMFGSMPCGLHFARACCYMSKCCGFCFFFFNDTATTEIYTLSLHDALPICPCAGRRAPRGGQHGLAGRADSGAIRPPIRADRKSTRLNSSHANISYAVFCLKKKK